VLGRKARKQGTQEEKGARKCDSAPPPPASNKASKGGTLQPPTVGKKGRKTPPTRIRPPRSAAVTITLPPGSEEAAWSYARVLSLAKQRVSLGILGISALRIKGSRAEGRVLEVPGVGSAARADSLAERLREVLADTPARVQRPVKTADVRVAGLDESATPVEVELALMEAGGCHLLEIKVGQIKHGPGGAGSVWVRYPVRAANKLAAVGRVRVGWTIARSPPPCRAAPVMFQMPCTGTCAGTVHG